MAITVHRPVSSQLQKGTQRVLSQVVTPKTDKPPVPTVQAPTIKPPVPAVVKPPTGTIGAMVSGAILFWDAGPTKHELLKAKLQELDLANFCPPPRSASEALRSALQDDIVSRRRRLIDGKGVTRDVIIQKHKDRCDGYEVVRVDRGDKENEYYPVYSTKVVLDQNTEEQVVIAGDYTQNFVHRQDGSSLCGGSVPHSLLQTGYDRYRSEITGGAVGRSLVALLAHLNGTCVRAVGGIYYLPHNAVSAWDSVVNAYEQASPQTMISRIKIVMDDQAVRTVKKAIEDDLTKMCELIKEEIRDNDLGDRALENRKRQALDLRRRCKEYEDILKVQLTGVHTLIDSAEQAASAAMSQQDAAQAPDLFGIRVQ